MQNHSTAAQTTTSDTFPAYSLSSLVQQTTRRGRSAARMSNTDTASAARSFFAPIPAYPRHRSPATAVAPSREIAPANPGVRERIRLDRGWRFRLGDPADAQELFTGARLKPIQGDFLSPLEDDSAIVLPRGRKAEETLGGGISWVRPEFGDADWALLESSSDDAREVVIAAEPTAVWYRQSFKTPASDCEKKVLLEIEDLSPCTHLWINGLNLGSSRMGSPNFRRDLTTYLVPGGMNTLVVRVAGLGKLREDLSPCRAILIVKTGVLHASSQGVSVTGAQRSGDRAELAIGTLLHNEHRNARRGTMIATILDPAGRSVAESQSAFHIFGEDRTRFEQKLTLNHAGWLAEDPANYLVRITIVVDGRVLDEDITSFDLKSTLSGTNSRSFIAFEEC